MMLEKDRKTKSLPRMSPRKKASMPQLRAISRRSLPGRRRRMLGLVAGALACSVFYLSLGSLLGTDGSFGNAFVGTEELEEPPVPDIPTTPIITFGTMGTHHNVQEYGAGSSDLGLQRSSIVTPEQWSSRLCLQHWGRKELLTEVDPNGYIVFVSGAEQLGGNKYLLTDGLFIAKALGRTLVEYPAKDARISVANATMGIGSYWDLSAMCMNHRILDLRAFRRLVEQGLIPADEFITIETGLQQVVTTRFTSAARVREFYEGKTQYKVIVMEETWKSQINRKTLAYLQPNPFFFGVVRMLLLDHEEFANGNFLAVQWRTETSTGDMVKCYDELRASIEEHRLWLGLRRDQVLFCTDMHGNTSGTYEPDVKLAVGAEAIRRIRQDYPKALDNRLHDFFNRIEDTGIKAIVSGLVIAQARMLLATSLNVPESKDIPEAARCQKPFSGYIHLIVEWRMKFFQKPAESVVRLFPQGEWPLPTQATSADTSTSASSDGAEADGVEENRDETTEETTDGAKEGFDGNERMGEASGHLGGGAKSEEARAEFAEAELVIEK